jgi:hypothetical protein
MLETYKYLFSYFRGNENNFRIENLPLEDNDFEEVKSYKVAKLEDPFLPIFSGFTHGNYTSFDSSKCKFNINHNFSLDCTCGFYSYKDISKAIKKANLREGSVLLEVENYGDIVEYDLGFRSEEQEVVAIYFNDDCYKRKCILKPQGVISRHGSYFSACLDHSDRTLITFKKLRSTLNLEISTISFGK